MANSLLYGFQILEIGLLGLWDMFQKIFEVFQSLYEHFVVVLQGKIAKPVHIKG